VTRPDQAKIVDLVTRDPKTRFQHWSEPRIEPRGRRYCRIGCVMRIENCAESAQFSIRMTQPMRQ